jgi:hypothetical protein
VSDREGIEISLSCNLNAFEWIISHLSKNNPKPGEERAKSEEGVELQSDDEVPLENINEQNCMNILQTLEFLKLRNIYEQIWSDFLSPDFADIINKCTLNLSGLNSRFLVDVNNRIKLAEILRLTERPDPQDKFLSLLFRQRLDTLLSKVELFKCEGCSKIMTAD